MPFFSSWCACEHEATNIFFILNGNPSFYLTEVFIGSVLAVTNPWFSKMYCCFHSETFIPLTVHFGHSAFCNIKHTPHPIHITYQGTKIACKDKYLFWFFFFFLIFNGWLSLQMNTQTQTIAMLPPKNFMVHKEKAEIKLYKEMKLTRSPYRHRMKTKKKNPTPSPVKRGCNGHKSKITDEYCIIGSRLVKLLLSTCFGVQNGEEKQLSAFLHFRIPSVCSDLYRANVCVTFHG